MMVHNTHVCPLTHSLETLPSAKKRDIFFISPIHCLTQTCATFPVNILRRTVSQTPTGRHLRTKRTPHVCLAKRGCERCTHPILLSYLLVPFRYSRTIARPLSQQEGDSSHRGHALCILSSAATGPTRSHGHRCHYCSVRYSAHAAGIKGSRILHLETPLVSSTKVFHIIFPAGREDRGTVRGAGRVISLNQYALSMGVKLDSQSAARG